MAYEPKTWQCGEVVSADALNHLEQGVAEASEGGGGSGSSILVIRLTQDGDCYKMDKTFQQIYDHINNGGIAVVFNLFALDGSACYEVKYDFASRAIVCNGTFSVEVYLQANGNHTAFNCDSADGYPTWCDDSN